MTSFRFWLAGYLLLAMAGSSHADKNQNRKLMALLSTIFEKSGMQVQCGDSGVEDCLVGARTLASIAEDKTIQQRQYTIIFSHKRGPASPDGYIFVAHNDKPDEMRKHIANQYFDVAESEAKRDQLAKRDGIQVSCSVLDGHACKTGVEKIESLRNLIDMKGMKIAVYSSMNYIKSDSLIWIDWKASRLDLFEHLKKQQ